MMIVGYFTQLYMNYDDIDKLYDFQLIYKEFLLHVD